MNAKKILEWDIFIFRCQFENAAIFNPTCDKGNCGGLQIPSYRYPTV